MKFASCLVVLIMLTLIMDTEGWFWRRRRRISSCQYEKGAKPYYFGTTSLSCMMKGGKKGKRGAPTRSTLRWAHRFIYYDGYYFEFGIGGSRRAIYGLSAVASHRCSSSRESSPAGYSTVSVECLKRCTDKYKSRYGSYNFLFHNCHHFANRMSRVLCNYRSCPSWCT